MIIFDRERKLYVIRYNDNWNSSPELSSPSSNIINLRLWPTILGPFLLVLEQRRCETPTCGIGSVLVHWFGPEIAFPSLLLRCAYSLAIWDTEFALIVKTRTRRRWAHAPSRFRLPLSILVPARSIDDCRCLASSCVYTSLQNSSPVKLYSHVRILTGY